MTKRNNITRLWEYEQAAALALLPDAIAKGRLDLPTGGGKGVIARELIRAMAAKSKRPIVVCVYTPRLLLNKQWVVDCNEYLNRKNGLSFNFVNVSSDNVGAIGKRIEAYLYKIRGAGVLPPLSTTNPDNLVKRVERLVRDNCNVLVVATYHSNQTIVKSGIEFDLVVYDEAHYLPTGKSELLACDDDFFEATKTKARKKIFTTATPKLTPSERGKGMNNEDVYGPVIFTKSPKELIEAGAIVKPFIHVQGTSSELEGVLNADEDIVLGNSPTVNDRSFNLQADMIYQAFDRHLQAVKDGSVNPDRIGAKMLVVCKGSGNMRGIFESRRFKELRKANPGVKIYGLCVDWGIEFDGHHYKLVSNRRKEEFLESVWNMKHEDNAIIFHVDMIGVGLDVPMLTGVMFMRCCDKTKFQQNIGRAARLHPDDRERIENGQLKVGDYANYIKPRYYVIIPCCFEDREDFYRQYRDWLVELRNSYNWNPSSTMIPARTQPAPTDDPGNELLPHMRGVKQEDIEAFYHRIEHNELLDEQESFTDEFLRQLKAGNDEILTSLSLG